MIKEFNNETQAKAVSDSLGLFMTKHRGVYIVGNNKEEILALYINTVYFNFNSSDVIPNSSHATRFASSNVFASNTSNFILNPRFNYFFNYKILNNCESVSYDPI